MAEKKPIRVGSIIHLHSRLQNGGYLDTRGRAIDKRPFFANQINQGAHIFVFTYGGETQNLGYGGANRDLGSGSWRILSAADKKPKGDPLVVGDKIHLQNCYPNVGYLDVNDDIKNIIPFKAYAESEGSNWGTAKGIFTTSNQNRNNGSGTWIVRSENKADGEPIFSNDPIRLESDYPSAGFLEAYSDKTVTDNDAFKEYAGQQYFVFANQTPNRDRDASSWNIVLSHLSHNIYHVETKPSHESVSWDYEGMFEIGGREGQPVKIFKATSTDGKILIGNVTYINVKSVDFNATLSHDNVYKADFKNAKAIDWLPDGTWKLGTATKRIVAIDIRSEDGGYSFNGRMQYEGGNGPLVVRGKKAKPQDTATTAPDKPLPDHASSMRVVMDSTNGLLRDALTTMLGGAQEAELRQLLHIKEATGKHDSDLLKEIQQFISKKNVIGFKDTEYTFYIKQLIKLYILSNDLNAFLLDTLPNLITDQPFHLVRKSLRLAATDHETIQRATLQRHWNKHVDDKYYLSDHARRVLLMDKLAIMSVAPCQHLLLDDPNQLRVVTYFSTKTHIHHIPYDERDGRFLLVGVSYDYDRVSSIVDTVAKTNTGQTERAYELMAIPHEVGHYIYRHSRLDFQETCVKLSEFDSNEMRAKLTELNTSAICDKPESHITFAELGARLFHGNPYYHWCEDIFADIYGCVVSGPLTVLGLQAMLGATDTNRAWTDDEEHPTPVLRPFVLSEILRILNELAPVHYSYSDVIVQLDQTWADALEAWGYERVDGGTNRPVRIKLLDKPNGNVHLEEIVNIDKIIQAICPMLYTFAKLLVDNATFNDSNVGDDGGLPTQIPWSRNDHKQLRNYDAEIEHLTKGYTAQKNAVAPISSGFSLSAKHKKTSLEAYLDIWGESGPLGHGDHPG